MLAALSKARAARHAKQGLASLLGQQSLKLAAHNNRYSNLAGHLRQVHDLRRVIQVLDERIRGWRAYYNREEV